MIGNTSLHAPDFSLTDSHGQAVQLSNYLDRKHVVLVFNRSFYWPFCRRHMAQLRQDYQQFVDREAEIIVVGPENEAAFAQYWQQEQMPFIGLPDPDHTVANLYGQEVKLLKLGRMPALIVIDKRGQIQYSHYGNAMQDIAANEDVLAVLDRLNQQG